MPDHLNLAPSHRGDPVESRLAADKVDAANQLRAVLTALYESGVAMSDDDLAEKCGLLRTSAGTRRGVGVRRQWIERAGRSVTPRGNPCATWKLTDAGRAYVESLDERRCA